MKELASFNALVRQWADRQPAGYKLSALAFGYRCDRLTHSFDGTLKWISEQSRKRKGEGVSRATLARHLKVFEADGVITVERRRNLDKNMSSVYHVDFDKVIEAEDMGRRQRRRNRETRPAEDAGQRAWIDSMEVDPPVDADRPEHSGKDLTACPACQALPEDADKLKIHVAHGGQDPWDET